MTIEAQKGDRPPIINPIFVGASPAPTKLGSLPQIHPLNPLQNPLPILHSPHKQCTISQTWVVQ